MPSLFIIDPIIENFEEMRAGLPEDVEVLILDPSLNGVEQIAAYLAGTGGYDAIHVISHGSSGQLYLAGDIVEVESVWAQKDLWTRIGHSLAESGDILFYGCNVAQGDAGQEFITSLARITSADVGASVNTTGAASLGGDWVLEKSTGPLDAVPLTVPEWSGVLPMTSTPIAQQFPGHTAGEWGNLKAFAALKSDGSVVTWGAESHGGNCISVWAKLSAGVQQIFSSMGAFAALKSDGSVVTWGSSFWGGNSSNVASKLSSDVQQISSTDFAFAALKNDGSVVTWGGIYGGDSSAVASKLSSGVRQIFSNYYAFAALKSDGSVITWGEADHGGDSSSVATKLSSGVRQIFSSMVAFAALKSDGSVVTWGDSFGGGDSSAVVIKVSSGVRQIFSTDYAFAALKSDGSVVTWGGWW